MLWALCCDCVPWDRSPSAHLWPHIPPHTYAHTAFISLSFLFQASGQRMGRSPRLFRLESFRVIFTSLPSVPLSTVKDYSWDMTQAAGCWWCHLRVVDGTESRRRLTCQLHLTPCRIFTHPWHYWSLWDYLLCTLNSAGISLCDFSSF